jgi:hypoxanthine phosphoribosyltransferase
MRKVPITPTTLDGKVFRWGCQVEADWVRSHLDRQLAAIRSFAPHYVMGIPYGGFAYAQILAEYLGCKFHPYNPAVVAALNEENLRLLLVDDSIGSGDTLRAARAAMPLGTQYQMAAIWVDRDYHTTNPVDYRYMFVTEPEVWYLGWWENWKDKIPPRRNSTGGLSFETSFDPMAYERIIRELKGRGVLDSSI